ncbi:MAG TPA: amino acid permease [Candidatus Angelobacter sp.]|nr:amino acid permease [Candidatus Angelobacter sp.]
MSSPADPTPPDSSRPLARRLGLFDTTMLVMGGTIGAGIFINPYVVARQVHTPALVMGAWLTGGVIALTGAFIYAELAARLPHVGGQYAYLRETYHPLLAFLYGWVLLLVIQTGGMAAGTVTFSRYFLELTGVHAAVWQIAALALVILTVINCLGVRNGGTVQSILMVIKIFAIVLLAGAGVFFTGHSLFHLRPVLDQPVSPGLISSFGAAMVPVLFAYGGWQTACFVAGEMKNPRRDLPRALVLGVIGVAALYSAVNYVYLRTLGITQLAQTETPASAVMRLAMGSKGAAIIGLGITVSTLGFLSQSVLTAPRVYFAMAEDRTFFRQLAWVHPRTRVPVVAIVLQSVWTFVILLSGRYEQILNYVTSMDWIFFGLSASCLFLLRRRNAEHAAIKMPGHPVTTALFCLACAGVVANTIYRYPGNTLAGVAILAAGVPVYFFWKRTSRA